MIAMLSSAANPSPQLIDTYSGFIIRSSRVSSRRVRRRKQINGRPGSSATQSNLAGIDEVGYDRHGLSIVCRHLTHCLD